MFDYSHKKHKPEYQKGIRNKNQDNHGEAYNAKFTILYIIDSYICTLCTNPVISHNYIFSIALERQCMHVHMHVRMYMYDLAPMAHNQIKLGVPS